MSYVGAALSPRETKKLVLGSGSYIGDLTAPGLLHAAFVTFPERRQRVQTRIRLVPPPTIARTV